MILIDEVSKWISHFNETALLSFRKDTKMILRVKCQKLLRNFEIPTRYWKDTQFIVTPKKYRKETPNFFPRVSSELTCVKCALQGIYRFTNLILDFTNLGIKHFIYGKWRGDVQLIKNNGQVAGCFRALADTVPA